MRSAKIFCSLFFILHLWITFYVITSTMPPRPGNECLNIVDLIISVPLVYLYNNFGFYFEMDVLIIPVANSIFCSYMLYSLFLFLDKLTSK